MLSMLNENWLRLDHIEFLLCWVFECGRRLCPCALEKVLDCFQLLFALTQLLNFFNLQFFFHVTSFCRRSHASTFQYRRMESNIFKKLAKQPDGRLLQKHGQCSRVVRMDRRNTRGFLRVYRIVERKERVRRVM